MKPIGFTLTIKLVGMITDSARIRSIRGLLNLLMRFDVLDLVELTSSKARIFS
jgi:hypothetical protein